MFAERNEMDCSESNNDNMCKTSLLGNLLADTATGHTLSVPLPERSRDKHNVTVRLSDASLDQLNSKLAVWLIRAVQFTKSLPVFSKLNTHDQLVLLNSSWKELVMLYMAEEHMEFSVEENEPSENSTAYQLFSEGHPTLKSVEQFRFALQRCSNMNPDLKEFAYLRKVAVLNSEVRGLHDVAAVEEACEATQTSLMEYLSVRYPHNQLRLSHVLLLLPSVRGYPAKIFENLFYKHLIGDTTIDSILLELLQ
ncbi:photoreceptor-specific nuclear receptor-like isoform X2 [Ptychodera flava]